MRRNFPMSPDKLTMDSQDHIASRKLDFAHRANVRRTKESYSSFASSSSSRNLIEADDLARACTDPKNDPADSDFC
jgi:hypothetical protein